MLLTLNPKLVHYSGHTVKLFFSGDYEFLCRVYGLSGPSGKSSHFTFDFVYLITTGKHNCLWCLTPSSQLSIPLEMRKRYKERTLESIRNDHKEFMDKGKGNVNIVKSYNNALREPMVNIDISRVRNTCVTLILNA